MKSPAIADARASCRVGVLLPLVPVLAPAAVNPVAWIPVTTIARAVRSIS